MLFLIILQLNKLSFLPLILYYLSSSYIFQRKIFISKVNNKVENKILQKKIVLKIYFKDASQYLQESSKFIG